VGVWGRQPPGAAEITIVDKGIHFQRQLRALLIAQRRGKIRRARVDAAVRGWVNHVRYGNTWGLRRALLRRVRLGADRPLQEGHE